jgi:hypothetical protein
MAKQIVCLIDLSLVPDALNYGTNIERGNVRGGPTAPNRNELASNISFRLVSLALSLQFFSDEMFGYREECRFLLPQFSGTVSFFFLRWVNASLDEFTPLPRLLPSVG